MSDHNFKLFVNTGDKSYKAKEGSRLWHCKGCDTIILYDNRFTERMVNQLVDKSKLIHIPIEKN